MKSNRKVIARAVITALYFIIGAAIGIYGEFGTIDSYWSGLGGALVVVGALQMIRIVRYNTSAKYKEETDTAIRDERNRFLSTKAWSWAGYLYIMAAAVASIVFKFLNQETLMFAASGSVCIILVLYWISYFILHKKY
jgi:uncharacterized membrane protein